MMWIMVFSLKDLIRDQVHPALHGNHTKFYKHRIQQFAKNLAKSIQPSNNHSDAWTP